MSELPGQDPEQASSWRAAAGGDQIVPPVPPVDPDDSEPSPEHRLVPPETILGVARFSQQEAQRYIGAKEDHEYFCTPTAFFALADHAGYMPNKGSWGLSMYVKGIDVTTTRDPDRGWIRSALSQELRRHTLGRMQIVTWQTGKNNSTSLQPDNLARMYESGYLATAEEEQFFRDQIVGPDPEKGRDISEIVRNGYPVMVTVAPGFAHNTAEHTIIIDGWGDESDPDASVHIVDPDSRNDVQLYTPEHVRQYLTGASTVIIPAPRKKPIEEWTPPS